MLEKRLNRESEPVACPNCQWVNAELVAGYRRTRFRNLSVGGIVAAVIGGLAVLISVNASGHRYDNNVTNGLIAGGITAVVIAGTCIALQRLMRGRINPNKSFPNPPKLPAGTPKGYTEQDLSAVRETTRSGRFVQQDTQNSEFPDWVVFRSGHLALPRVCCECLAPATTALKSHSANSMNAFLVPVCADCDSRIKATKRWVYLQAVIGVVLATGLTFFAVNGKTDERVGVSVVVAIAAVIVAAVIAGRFGQPFMLKTVDAARGVFRLKFRSEQYTEIVRQATAAHEAAPFQPPMPAIPMN